MTAHDLRRAPMAPSLDLASQLLHDYAELQRASDKMLKTALEMGVNPTEVAQLVTVQREMLGGFLTLAVGQIDLMRLAEYTPQIAAVLAAQRPYRNGVDPVIVREADTPDDPTGYDAGRQ